MNYQALYRKYRPKNFNEVVGQQVTMKILKNSIVNNQITHAYLFYGPRGTGKTSIAKILARTVNCINNENSIPCEKCENCFYSSSPNCPDIIEIDAASNNGVDEIRELKSKILFSPTELKYKVYIVDEVHMLSTGAFNALLKTLEEPPEHTIFILATTELQKVPLTIISRCQTFEFKKIDDQSMYNKLRDISNKENINIEDSGIWEIIKNSNGGLRDAIGLLEKANSFGDQITANTIREISGNISKEELESFVNLLKNNCLNDVLEKVNYYYNNGIDLIKLTNNIINYIRDEMILTKKYNNNYCSLILELDSISTKMEKSQNPKILLEITLINYLSNNNCDKIDVDITNKVKVNENNDNYNLIEENKELINNEIKNSNNANVENIKSIRISNTLCKPNKEIISSIRNKWNILKDYAFDEDFGNIARILSTDIIPVAASNTNIILVSKLIGISNQLNNDLTNVENLFYKIFDNKFKVIFLSNDEWQKCKNEYKNNKEKFKYIEEIKANNNAKTLIEKANELFN